MMTVLIGAACMGIGAAFGSAWATRKQGAALAAKYHKGHRVGYQAGHAAARTSAAPTVAL